MRQKRRRLPALRFAEDGKIPPDAIPGPVDVQVHLVVRFARRVHEEHDRGLQSLDLVQVHNADSRRLVRSCRHAVVLLFLFHDLPEVLRQVGGRPQAGLLRPQTARCPWPGCPPGSLPPAAMPASTVSPRSATIFSMAATGGILASHRAYFLSRSKAS